MTGRDPRIVGTLSDSESPVEVLPPGFIALFVATTSVYRWEVVRAVDVMRVREGDKPGRRRTAPDSSETWMEVQVVIVGPGHPSTFVLDTATLQEVLDALVAAAQSTLVAAAQVVESVLPWDATAPFGAYLRRIRAERGWSTWTAGKHLGFSQTYVWNLENKERRRPPGMGVLQRLASGYGLDIRDVLREAGFRHVPRTDA